MSWLDAPIPHLRDANYKEVASKEFKTDRFGSFNGEFTIPAQTLSGNFTLVTERFRTNIRVEEYKRPTFKVSSCRSRKKCLSAIR